MGTLRAVWPVMLAGVTVSAAIALAGALWFLKPDSLAAADKDWARPDGAFAIAFLALVVGTASAAASAALLRWRPTAVVAVGLVASGLGAYLSWFALDQKPALAPEFLVLHAVLVIAFGLLLPYRLFVTRSPRRPAF